LKRAGGFRLKALSPSSIIPVAWSACKNQIDVFWKHRMHMKDDFNLGDQYDRFPIDSILYLKCFNKVSNTDWLKMLKKLNHYKEVEMIVHKNNLI
jgi:hypothetical protein